VVQVITSVEAPYRIMWASKAWLSLCGFEAREVMGKTLSVIQGPLTMRASIDQIMNAAIIGGTASVTIINHTRSGEPFSHSVRVEPLRDASGLPRCFQASSSNIVRLPLQTFAAAAVHQPYVPGALQDALAGSDLSSVLSKLGGATKLAPSLQPPSAWPAMAPPLSTTHTHTHPAEVAVAQRVREDARVEGVGLEPAPAPAAPADGLKTLHRNVSELKICDMLDLFDQA